MMGATVVVGGQYGSEGKGKVAQFFAAKLGAAAAVRVGGPNSGHTTADTRERTVLRQLPTAAVLEGTTCMLGAGSYVDPLIVLDEVHRVGLSDARLVIDWNAVLVTDEDRASEIGAGIGSRLGSTCSGTGAALIKRVTRRSTDDLVSAHPGLERYLGDVPLRLREILEKGDDVIVEGTQGFGLSVLHGRLFPKVTTRDTTAAAALSEAGLSPLDVKDVVLVLRAFPIRVAGDSGDFVTEEIDWDTVAREGGLNADLREYTSVTGRVRRVARFDPELARRAIAVNNPTIVVLNHVDYVDASSTPKKLSRKAAHFVEWVEESIGRQMDFIGVGPDALLERHVALARAA